MCTRSDIKEACPSACGVCCGDDPTYTFLTDNVGEKDCRWIAKRIDRRSGYCDQRITKAACQLTCDNCTPAPESNDDDESKVDDD